MIRRDTHYPSGISGWVLISQPEHARIAGELARHWLGVADKPAPIDLELLAAVYHHDDGWQAWERQPDVDPATGRPLNFTEMPLPVALEIWQRSIDRCVAEGPLAGYVVSGHFSGLLRHANHWQHAVPQDGSAAAEFLSRQDVLRCQLLGDWIAAGTVNRSADRAEQGLHWLQFFDAFSLWLCTAERHRPDRLDLPCGGALALQPHGIHQIGVFPWPFAAESLEVVARGRLLPQGRYATPHALAVAPGQPVTLDWRLLPGQESSPA